MSVLYSYILSCSYCHIGEWLTSDNKTEKSLHNFEKRKYACHAKKEYSDVLLHELIPAVKID